jgi:hypothetical protein
MALTDDLKTYIAKYGSTALSITEKHAVAIIGEFHASAWNNNSLFRTTASVRLVLELLRNPRYRFLANEHFANAGPVRLGVRDYLRAGKLPPPVPDTVDPNDLTDREIQERGKSIATRRFQAVLDFLRANPRAVLAIGSSSSSGASRDRRLAQHFFEELADRDMTASTPGVTLLGASHAAAVPINGWPTTRMLLEQRGHVCVSILVLTDVVRDEPDDAVMPLVKDQPIISPWQVTRIRLTPLASSNPCAFPTNRPLDASRPSPFRSLTFGGNDRSVAEQFEYIVLQKA